MADRVENHAVPVVERPPHGPGRLLGAVVMGFALLLALPAWSANLVQVRVGNHPTYTRVVFEFDGPTGYRVERRNDADPSGTIVVTLDAQSHERNIVSTSKGVETVQIAAGTTQTVAEIHTRESGMPIREMILADPPRVVLDLLLPASAVTAQAPAVPERPASEVTATEPAPEVPAEPEVELEVATEAVAVPAPPAVEVPAGEVPLAEAAPSEAGAEVVAEEEVAEVPAQGEPATAPLELPLEVLAEAGDAARETEAVDLVAELEDARTPAEQAAEVAVPQRGESPAAVPLAATETATDLAEKIDLKFAATIAAGVLAIGLIAFFFLRSRRAKPDSMDVTALVDEDDAEADEAGWSVAEADATAESSFSGSDRPSPAPGTSLPEEDFEFTAVATDDDENKPIEAAVAAIDSAPGLFDEAPQDEVATMMDDQDLPTRMDSEAPTQLGFGAAAVGDSDVSKLLKEFERRMAHMEARLDESNEARERLERQVEAQNEELRVQRAAIARTQRALRSLNRSEEDQATEPALRDPSTPTS